MHGCVRRHFRQPFEPIICSPDRSGMDLVDRTRRLKNVIKLTLVLIASLLLLLFVGFGEARRTYPALEVEKMAAQGELARNAIESYLRSDLPLDQFPGFPVMTQPILESDPSICSIYVSDPFGGIVFSSALNAEGPTSQTLDLGSLELLASFQTSTFQPQDGYYTVTENDDFYRVSFDLANRYEIAGQLHVVVPKAVVRSTIANGFQDARLITGFMLAIFMLLMLGTSRLWMSESGWSRAGGRLLSVAFTLSFIVVAIFVIYALVTIYTNGVEARSKALSTALAQRLKTAFNIGLTLDDFRQLETVFEEYKTSNPDLSFVTLTSGDKILVDAKPDQIGKPWNPPPAQLEYQVILEQDTLGQDREKMTLHMGIPQDLVYQRLWRSAKNFLVLFIAAAFLARLFFALIRAQSNMDKLVPGTLHTRRGHLLGLIGPAYFMLIFVTNGLTISFLPKYFEEILAASGAATLEFGNFSLPLGISTLFTVYFLSYALSLPIAGRYAEKREPRTMLMLGGFMVLISLLWLIFLDEISTFMQQWIAIEVYHALIAIMTITGFGEGLFFIAVQSYILRVASPDQRTKGAATIVNSLYGGLLAGMAIGALLVVDPLIGQQGVFTVGALVTVLVLFYIIWIIPGLDGEDFTQPKLSTKEEATREEAEAFATLTLTGEVSEAFLVTLEEEKRKRGLSTGALVEMNPSDGGTQESDLSITGVQAAESPQVAPKASFTGILSDLDFIKTALLIGVPVKIIWTGLFKASFPLVLSRQNYPTEDVGQIMMLYIIGVLLTSAIIPRIADKMGKTRPILFLGAVGSGVGLILIGLIGFGMGGTFNLAYATTLLLLSGMLILGISHGFIQAPIITHVSNTDTAEKMGRSQATSLYRLLERVGNVGGPILIGTLLVYSDYNASLITWIGISVVLFGILFLIQVRRRSKV